MKKFRILTILLIICLAAALFPASALAVDDPAVTAEAAIVMDADSGTVYYEKNADDRVQPASTTKMVTALLVIEAIERGEIGLGDTVTAGDDCQYNLDEESSNADPIIEPGETLTVEDLLYCTMLVSANEACNILASYVAGSVDDFIDLMNERAEELGCTGTHFDNANGLEDSDHYTTARDFALIAQEAVSHPQLIDICSATEYTVPATNVNDARELENTNELLNPDSSYYYPAAYGIKTGYFNNAGYCLVSVAEDNNIKVITVVMGSDEKGDNFADTVTLFDWMFDNYSYHNILSSTETLYTVPVELGMTDSTGLRADNDISVILSNEEEASVQYQVTLYHEQENTTLQAPISAGDVLGEVTAVELDGSGNVVRTYGSAYLVATNSVEMSRGVYIRAQIAELFQTKAVKNIIIVLIVILALYLVLVVFYRIQRRRHVRSVRMAKRERAARMAQQEAGWLNIPQDQRRGDPGIGYFDSEPVPQQNDYQYSRPAQPEEYSRESSNKALDDYFDSFFNE